MKQGSHIVILSPGFATDESDSYCIPPLQIYLRSLHKKYPDIRISVIALQYPYEAKEYSWHGIQVYACGGNNKSFPFRLQKWKKAKSYFLQLHKEQPVFQIHSLWLTECAFLGEKWSSSFGIPHLCTLMGQEVRKPNWYFKFLPLKKMTLVALSEFQSEVFKKEVGVSIKHIIPWGLEVVQEQSASARAIDILGVGSLTELKNYTLFIDVIKKVQQQKKDLKVVLIGDGPQREKLEELSKEKGLKECIDFKGIVPRDEVMDWMSRSKVLLHTSTYESFGYVFAEALQSGMHIVSSGVGIAKQSLKWEIVDHEEDYAKRVFLKLEAELDHQPENDLRVEKTVEEYASLYCIEKVTEFKDVERSV